ncbi:hypothetical protein DL89DRAFT_265844 [Linderina pennispora]|uniref:RNI-like protein n=1 Tax=Linderina pennispora TaxID=61395 RepID=A0A1Y1WFY5_9FUNG|nr:uncharacterized protein DL89DRAFT_265844 [Linderina pennispora]ORX72238.1 hypothetical protein DL89DRAFT_265844 [Linderina pennispora]
MPALAQNLPSLVLRQTFYHAVNFSDNDYESALDVSRARQTSLLVFMAVCQQWRYSATSLLFSTASLCGLEYTGDSDSIADAYTQFNTMDHALKAGAKNSIKSVEMIWSLDDIANGRALDVFKAGTLENQVLNATKAASYTFILGEGSGILDSPSAAAKAREFCQAIHSTFPNATTVDFQGFLSCGTDMTCPFMSTLLSGLLEKADTVLAHLDTMYDLSLDTGAILSSSSRSLRKIAFKDTEITASGIEAIRCQSETLEHLELTVEYLSNLQDILVSSNGSPVVYNKLKTLILEGGHSYSPPLSDKLQNLDSVPFPVLERLKYSVEELPMQEITLRGNGATLRELALRLDTDDMNTLSERGIFDIDRFPALKHLDLSCENLSGECSVHPITAALTMGRNATHIVSAGYEDVGFGAVETDLNYLSQNIQSIDCRDLILTLEDTVRLIRMLPSLRRLQVGMQESRNPADFNGPHTFCAGKCTAGTGLYDDSNWWSAPISIFDFVVHHIDAICADIGDIELMFKKVYPLSTRSITVGVSHMMLGSCMMQAARAIVSLALLCPDIRFTNTPLIPTMYSGPTTMSRCELEQLEAFKATEAKLRSQ